MELAIGITLFIVAIGGSVLAVGWAGRRVIRRHAARLASHLDAQASPFTALLDSGTCVIDRELAIIDGRFGGRAVSINLTYGAVDVHCDVPGGFDAQRHAIGEARFTITAANGRALQFENLSDVVLARLEAADTDALHRIAFAHDADLLTLESRKLGITKLDWLPSAQDVRPVLEDLARFAASLEHGDG